MGKIIFKHNHVAKTKAVSVLVFLLIIAGCGTFGYSNSKYGAVVNCDADQPMDELLKCVDEKYAFMDKFYKSKWLETHEKLARFGKHTYEKPSDYQEIDKFVSIKKDDEYLRKNGYPDWQIRGDNYNGTEVQVLQLKGDLWGTYSRERQHKKSINGKWNKYTRSLKAISRDALITKSGKNNKIYVASYELVPLKKDEFLFVVAVGNFCQKSEALELCGVNYIYFTGKMKPDLLIFTNPSEFPEGRHYWEKDLSDYTHEIITLSVNKRENPTELYIKLNNRYFSLKLS